MGLKKGEKKVVVLSVVIALAMFIVAFCAGQVLWKPIPAVNTPGLWIIKGLAVFFMAAFAVSGAVIISAVMDILRGKVS